MRRRLRLGAAFRLAICASASTGPYRLLAVDLSLSSSHICRRYYLWTPNQPIHLVLLRLRLNLSAKSSKRSAYKSGTEVGNKHKIKQSPLASPTAAADLFPTTKAVAEAGLEKAETYSTYITVFHYRQIVLLPVGSDP
jgi:hypothetical protein